MIKKVSILISVLVVVSMMLTAVAFAQGPVLDAGNTYFSNGTKNIKAADLFANLNDGDTSNDPYIISLCKPDDFALGHIPGAVNISVKDLFTPDVLATLPKDQEIVVYCYTGQTSSQAVAGLNMLGYNAKSMLFGFPAWAMIEEYSIKPFNPDGNRNDFRVSTEPVEAMASYDLPAPLGDTAADAALAYFSNGTKNTTAEALFENLNDGDTSNDPVVVDVRKKEDYDKAHVPGALYISAKEAATADALKMIDPSKQVVVYCYTGQTGSQVTALLNMLGYDAYNMKFGFASWSPQGKYAFNAYTSSPNYRFEGTGTLMETGAAPAAETTAAAAPAAQPAELPTTGGVPADFTWLYILMGSGLVGTGAFIRRRK